MTNVSSAPGADDLQLDMFSQPPVGAYEGVDRAEKGAESGWWDAAMREVTAAARSGYPFTADLIRNRVGEPDNSARWGALFRAARRDGTIEPTGRVVPSSTPSRHGAIVREWVGTSAAAA